MADLSKNFLNTFNKVKSQERKKAEYEIKQEITTNGFLKYQKQANDLISKVKNGSAKSISPSDITKINILSSYMAGLKKDNTFSADDKKIIQANVDYLNNTANAASNVKTLYKVRDSLIKDIEESKVSKVNNSVIQGLSQSPNALNRQSQYSNNIAELKARLEEINQEIAANIDSKALQKKLNQKYGGDDGEISWFESKWNQLTDKSYKQAKEDISLAKEFEKTARTQKFLYTENSDIDKADIDKIRTISDSINVVAKESEEHQSRTWGSSNMRLETGTISSLDKKKDELYSQLYKILKKNGCKGSEIRELANDIVKEYSKEKNRIETEQKVAEMKKHTEEHPVIANVFERPVLNIAGGVNGAFASFASGLGDFVNDTSSTIDVNSEEFLGTNLNNAVIEQTKEKIGNSFNSERVKRAANFLYETGTSMQDFLTLMPLNAIPGGQGISLVLMGTEAMSNTAIELTKMGYNAQDTAVLATIAGLAEIVTEKVSVDKLMHTVKSRGIKSFVKNAISNIIPEGTEEVGSDIINDVADVLYGAFTGKSTQKEKELQGYLNDGLTYEEAERKYATEHIKEYVSDFAGGALSGGIMGGSASAINYVSSNLSAGARVNSANQHLSDIDTVAVNENGENVLGLNNPVLEKMFTKSQEYDSKSLAKMRENIKSKMSSGKKVGDFTTGRFVNNLTLNRNEVTSSVIDTVMKNDADAAHSLKKAVSGEELSKRDIKAIKNNSFAMELFSELSGYKVNADTPNSEMSDLSSRAFGNALSFANTQKKRDMVDYVNSHNLDLGVHAMRGLTSLYEDGADNGVTAPELASTYYEAYTYAKNGDEKHLFELSKKLETDNKSDSDKLAYMNNVLVLAQRNAQNDMIKPEDKSKFFESYGSSDDLTKVNSKDSKLNLAYAEENAVLPAVANDRLKELADIFDYDTFKVVVNNVDSESFSLYSEAVKEFYLEGLSNKLTFNSAKNTAKLGNLIDSGVVSEEFAKEMFDRGRKQANTEGTTKTVVTEVTGNKGGVVTVAEGTEIDKGSLKILERTAEITGLDFYINNSLNTPGFLVPKEGSIYLNPEKGDFSTFMHELSGEFIKAFNAEGFNKIEANIVEYVIDTTPNYRGILRKYLKAYRKGDPTFPYQDAVNEAVNDFIGGLWKTEEGMQKFTQWLKKDRGMSAEEKIGFVQSVKNLFKNFVSALKRFLGGSKVDYDMTKVGQQAVGSLNIFDDLLNALDKAIDNFERAKTGSEQKNITANKSSDIRHSLLDNIVDSNGISYGKGVFLDTNLFDDLKLRNWKYAFKQFIINNLAGEAITVYNEKGQPEIIEFAKKNERVVKDNTPNGHKVINKIIRKNDMVSQLSIVHIEELLNQSKDSGKSSDNSHQWLDKNGWEFKTVYVQTIKGNIYNVTLNIAKTADGRKILYDINKIKKVGTGDVASVSLKEMGSHTLPTLDTIKSQKSSGVNNNSMQKSGNNSQINLETAENSKQKSTTQNIKSDVRNSLNVNYDNNTDFTENINKVVNMDSVCDMTGTEFAKGTKDLITQVSEYFDSIGNVVHSKYGNVVLNRTGVKSLVAHGIGRNKAIAFKAVPSIIENGDIIDYKNNYKNRNYDTAVFAAPITISNTPYFAAVVVTVNKNSNEYYLHEIALQKKEDTVSFKTGNSKNATPSDTTSSIYSLLNKLQNVNNNSMQKAGNNTRRNSKEVGNYIKSNMRDSERYRILKDAEISVLDITDADYSKQGYTKEQVETINKTDFERLKQSRVKEAKKIIKPLAKFLKINEKVFNKDNINIHFTLSNGIDKSLNSQKDYGGSYSDFAKVLLNLQQLLDNSILIESHTDKKIGTPKENRNLKKVSVLFSAFCENKKITPIQFEVKQNVDNNNNLYLSVALTKIENSVIKNTVTNKVVSDNSVTVLDKVTLSQLFGNVNTRDSGMLKYIPSGFLNSEQLKVKNDVLDFEESRYPNYYKQNSNIRNSREIRSVNVSDEFKQAVERLSNNEDVTREELLIINEIRVAEANVGHIKDTDYTDIKRRKLQSSIISFLGNLGSFVDLKSKKAYNNVRENFSAQYSGPVKYEKKANIVIGLPASGKSTLAETLSQNNSSVIIDSDMAKELLPEYNDGYGASAVHNESKYIIDKVTDYCLAKGSNVIFPIVGANYNLLKDKIDYLHSLGYTVNVDYVDLPSNKAIGRALNRFIETGRFIPLKVLYGIGNKPREVFYRIYKEGIADGYSLRSNDVDRGRVPKNIQDIGGWGESVTGRSRTANDVGRKSRSKDVGQHGVNRRNSLEVESVNKNSLIRENSEDKGEARNYSYEHLVSKPDMPITVIDDTKRYNADSKVRKDIVNQSVENAKKVGIVNENGNAVIYVNDIETEIIVSKRAIKHSLDRRLGINAPVVLNIGSVLKNSIKINEIAPRNSNIENSYVLVGTAKNKQNEIYVVSFVVNKYTNEVNDIDVLYSVNAKTEPTGSLSPQVSTPATDSNISISKLLDYVNKYYPDILSEDVLDHYGHEVRPNGVLGKSAVYSREVESINNRSIVRENREIKLANDILRSELRAGKTVSASQLLKCAGAIKRATGTSLDKSSIALRIKPLFEKIASGEYSADNALVVVNDIAKELVEKRADKPAIKKEAVHALMFLKSNPVFVDESSVSALTFADTSWKSAFSGKIPFTANKAYVRNHKTFTELYNALEKNEQSYLKARIDERLDGADVTNESVALALLNVVDDLYSDYETDAYSTEDMTEVFAHEILAQYPTVRSRDTVAEHLHKAKQEIADNQNAAENKDIRFSVDIDNFDEDDNFDEVGYSIINITGKRGYSDLKHAVMTRDANKYLNEVRCISLAKSGFYVYKMLDTETKDILIYKPKSKTARREYNAIRRAYRSTIDGTPVSISQLIKNVGNDSNDNRDISGTKQTKSNNHDRINSGKIQGEGNSNGRGTSENDSNDNLQERGQINSGASLNSKYSTALTAGEWKKYNYAITSKVDAGLRISENAILVEGEKGEFNYKLVIYDNTFDEKPISAIYGIGETGFHQDITNFDAKAVAKLICFLEKDYYNESKIFKTSLRNIGDNYNLILGRYSDRSNKFIKYRRKSIDNGRNIESKSDGTGIFEKDRRNSREIRSVNVSDEFKQAVERLSNNEDVTRKELLSIDEINIAEDKVNIIKVTNYKDTKRQSMQNDIISFLGNLGSFVDLKSKKAYNNVREKFSAQYSGPVKYEKKANIVIGLPASGKSTLAETLSQNNSSVIIDSDMAKELLPEYNDGYGASAVHNESKYIIDKVTDYCLAKGSNVIFPIVGANYNLLKGKIDYLHSLGYTVNVDYVDLPSNKAIGRALSRFIETGRFIPLNVLYGIGNKPREVFYRIYKEGIADGYSLRSNDVDRGRAPENIQDIGGWGEVVTGGFGSPYDVRRESKQNDVGQHGVNKRNSLEVESVNKNSLIRENREIKLANDILRSELKAGKTVSASQLLKCAGAIKRATGTSLDKSSIALRIKPLFEKIASGEYSADNALVVANDIAKELVEKRADKPAIKKEAVHALMFLKSNPVFVDESSASALTFADTSWKSAFSGKIPFTANKAYVKNHKTFTELYNALEKNEQTYLKAKIDERIDGADITNESVALALLNVVDDLYSDYETDAYSTEDMTEVFAHEILAQYPTVRSRDTVAEHLHKANDEIVQRYERKLKDVKDKSLAREAVYKQNYKEYRERRKKSELKKDVKRRAIDLQNRLLTPKGSKYIPKNLVNTVLKISETLNLDTTDYEARIERCKQRIENAKTPEQRQKEIQTLERLERYYKNSSDALFSLQEQFKALKNRTDTTKYSYDAEIDAIVSGIMDELFPTDEKTGERSVTPLGKMNLEQLTLVDNMLRTVSHAVKQNVSLKNKEVRGNAYDMGVQAIEELENSGKLSGGKVAGTAAKVVENILNPKSEFNKLGGYKKNSVWNQMYRILNSGQHIYEQVLIDSNPYFAELMSDGRNKITKIGNLDKMNSYAEKDLLDVGLRDVYGNAVKITHGMASMIYLHLLSEENRAHIAQGGLTVPYLRDYYKNGSEAWGVKSVTVKVGKNISKLQRAVSEVLSEYDRKWIEGFRRYIDEYSTPLLNKITLERYGFEKATVSIYVPMHTDPSYFGSEWGLGDVSATLENAGFMKRRKKSGQPLLLTDIAYEANDMVGKVAQYAGFLNPVRDINLILNTQLEGYEKSVKSAIRQNYGEKTETYLKNLVNNVMGNRQKSSRASKTLAHLRSNFAQATLSVNPSVSLKQAASYPTAAAVLGYKALAKALAKPVKENGKGLIFSRAEKELIAKYSPLLAYRLQEGSYDEIGEVRAMNGSSFSDKVMRASPALFNWIQQIDGATVGRLWYASKYFVEDNYSSLKRGSDEYYKKVAEVFNDTVELTQPNYTAMQRTEFQRNGSEGVKMFCMFMTQRLQNFNIVYDACGEYSAMKRYYKEAIKTEDVKKINEARNNLKSSQKRLARSLSSQVVSAVVLASMEALVAVALGIGAYSFRDDDDEITAQSLIKRISISTAETIVGMVPFGSEITAVIESMFTGEEVSVGNAPIFENISNMLTAFTRSVNNIDKMLSDDVSDEEKSEYSDKALDNALTTITDLGIFFGIPTANIKKLVTGVVNDFKDVLSIGKGTYELQGSSVNRTPSDLMKKYVDAVFENDGRRAKEYKSQYLKTQSEKFTDEEFDTKVASYLAKNSEEIVKAVQSHLSGDLSEYNSAVNALVNKGFSEQTVLSAVNSVENKADRAADLYAQKNMSEFEKKAGELIALGYGRTELLEYAKANGTVRSESGYKYKCRYSETDLYNSFVNNTDFDVIYNEIVRVKVLNGYEEDKASASVTSMLKRELKSHDKTLMSAVSAYQNGQYDTYERKLKELLNNTSYKKVFTDEQIYTLVRGKTSSYVYSPSDVVDALENGYDVNTVVNKVINSYTSNGKTVSQAVGSIKSSLTSKYKKEYVSGSETQRREIRNKLRKSGVYSSLSDIAITCNRWTIR